MMVALVKPKPDDTFLTVLEGEADIICAVNGDVFDKAVPAVNAESFQRVRQLLEGLEEGFVFSSL